MDGKTPSIIAATNGGKLLIHSPHQNTQNTDGPTNPIKFLNLNRKITAIATGKISYQYLIVAKISIFKYRKYHQSNGWIGW